MAEATKSAAKVLKVLDLLLRGPFIHGLSPTDLARGTGFSPSNITHYVKTLIDAGFAERIDETGRIRPSVRHAQYAISIARSIDSAARRVEELKKHTGAQGFDEIEKRLTTPR